MGQAKFRREALRQLLLAEGKKWEFPESPWEADLCAELIGQKEYAVVVTRASRDQLAWARMPANECHANVRWYVENDPSKKAQAVVGWCVQWPSFVLHSVIRVDGNLICITPSHYTETEFLFLPDPKISWITDGHHYSAIRNGQKIGPGVRVFPSFSMAQAKIVEGRLLSGIDPRKAVEFTEEEMEELKRRYIPIVYGGRGG